MVKDPQNIVISHVYSSDNKGDAALTSVLIKDIKRAFPKAKIIILKLEHGGTVEYFEGVPEKPSFMHHALNHYANPVGKLAYTLFMLPSTMLWAAWHRRTHASLPLPKHLRETAAIYAQADLIIPVGGGYIRSRKGLLNRWNIPLLLHPLLFGYLLGKPTILYSQSVGPFHGWLESAMVAYTLRRMTLILLREDTSQQLLARMGVTKNVMRAVDSGFLLTSLHTEDLRKKYAISLDTLVVGVTVRSWLEGSAQQTYERAVAQALDNLGRTLNIHFLFIPQVTAAKGDDDRIVSSRVHALMRNRTIATVVHETPDHHMIKAMYAGLDALIGTRFHSVIFSLTSHVPVLAIEYEHKTSGIMHDLHLKRWVVRIEDVTAAILTKKMHELLGERARYRRQLRRRLPQYIAQAKQTIHLVADHYAAEQQDR